jgi:carbon dioxide concentrating mechanism protein CcmM
MKSLFQSSFIMLVLALIITIPAINSSSFSQEENTQGQEQQQQKIQSSQSGIQNLNDNKDEWPNIHENVITDFNSNVSYPQIENTAFIHPFAVVIGACYIGELVMVAPTAVCRGDEGTPIHISAHSNIQDDVVLHGLETTKDGKNLDNKRFTKDGELLLGNDTRFKDGYSVFVGERTSLAHGTLVHGPAYVGNDTFVGMESLVFNAKIGNNVAIGVSSTISGGVEIPDNKFVPPGSVITTQEQVDNLPSRIGSPYEKINEEVIHVNEKLGEGYEELNIEKIIAEREKAMEQNMLETGMPSSSSSSTQ